MKNQWKRTVLAAVLAAALLLVGCFAAAEGAEPYGDGDGVISRAQLAGLYNWLHNTDSEFFRLITFDQISDALGKKGCVKETDREEYHAAYWTDGDKFVTITFRNYDGSWGVTSVTTDIVSDEYTVADYSFLPRVGNRWAGSSVTELQTIKAKLQGTSDEVIVTAEVPVEYWTTASSFGEARILNVREASRASGNSAGIRVSFWPDEASLQAEREKSENIQELEDWAALGTTLKGYSFTRYGMDMTEYVLPLKEDLWMDIQFYNCVPYAGSEAEAIVYSLAVEYGDFTYACDVQPEAPAVSAPAQPANEPAVEPAPAAEADGGLAGKWVAVEMASGGETMNPADYGMEMSIELLEDGTAVANLEEEVTGTWSADGNQVAITIAGDTATAAVEDGVMVLPLGDSVSLKLVKDGAAAQGTEPEPTAEPAGEPTAVPAAGPLDTDEEAYVGVWNLIYLGTGGFTGNAADIGLTGETLTMNADRTSVLTLDPDQPARAWWMEDGIVRLDNGQRLALLREDVLQYGSELSGYMIFSKDPAMVWDGSIPMFDPFASTEPEPVEPAPAPAPDTPAAQGSGSVRTEVKYTAKTYIANGAEMDASLLGAEYSVLLHDDGTVECVLGGASVPGMLWKADGDAVVIDFFGNGEIRITAEDDGILLDYLGLMLLKMIP